MNYQSLFLLHNIKILEVDSDAVSIHHVKDGLDLATDGLDVLGALLDSVGKTTGEDDSEELKEGNSQSNTSNNSNISNKLVLSEGQTSNRVSILLLTVISGRCAAAGAGDLTIGTVEPVSWSNYSTALQIVLDGVPCVGNSSMSFGTIVLHAILELLLHNILEITLEHEGGNSGSALTDQQHRDEHGVDVDHTTALLPGSATSKESHNKDDHT